MKICANILFLYVKFIPKQKNKKTKLTNYFKTKKQKHKTNKSSYNNMLY